MGGTVLKNLLILACGLVTSSSALACGPLVAQFISEVGEVRHFANGSCEFLVAIDLRKPGQQFSPMPQCPLDIDLLSSHPVRQSKCWAVEGQTISGVLVKMTPDAEFLELE